MIEGFMQNPQLDGKPFYLKGGRTGFLLFHGFTATTVEVRSLAEYLYSQGYSVYGPLLPGHGTSPEDMNRCTWRDWTSAAETAYQQALKECGTIWVGGESMGGLLSLYLASQHPEIKGLILYAPALRSPKMWRTVFARFFVKTISKHTVDDSMPWQGYIVTPVQAAYQLYLLQKEIDRLIDRVQQPVAIFQGRLDRTISPESSPMVYDRIGSKVKQLRWYDNSRHCILLDEEFDKVAKDSLSFIHMIEDGKTTS